MSLSADFTIRRVRPDDAPYISALDTSFVTDRVLRVRWRDLSVALVEEPVEPPLRKDYGRITDDAELEAMTWALVAAGEGEVLGFAAGRLAEWNRRAEVRHLYVAPGHRGRGVGTALLDALERCARAAGARCLWVETQNVNLPAARFYLRRGFVFCGLDESLYDSTGPAAAEVALFFARPVAPPAQA